MLAPQPASLYASMLDHLTHQCVVGGHWLPNYLRDVMSLYVIGDWIWSGDLWLRFGDTIWGIRSGLVNVLYDLEEEVHGVNIWVELKKALLAKRIVSKEGWWGPCCPLLHSRAPAQCYNRATRGPSWPSIQLPILESEMYCGCGQRLFSRHQVKWRRMERLQWRIWRHFRPNCWKGEGHMHGTQLNHNLSYYFITNHM